MSFLYDTLQNGLANEPVSSGNGLAREFLALDGGRGEPLHEKAILV